MNPAALQAALRGDIEAQEAAGQAELVASGAKLPKEMRGATREQLEVIGFTFGADVDDLFVSVTLPPGWRLRATEHSMHSDLLDAEGAKRAGVFYKAAFYDRRADINFSPRYWVRNDYEKPVSTVTVHDEKTKQAVYRAGSCEYGARDSRRELEQKASAWLASQFPDHRDALAYW